ncbi:YesL family protein [Neobacillus pocheonensis]|uniref:YesL family protein n=1 Tax=Neobacillus pocheonensis TaxID=363869 RepID=A0ABT0W8E9_9BACI|nr:YesL family protein [Neobacillus pocheonensis]
MMKKRNEFGEGILFNLTNHIYSLLMTNIYFVLSNLLVLIFFITLKHSFTNITLYFLALIPTGPSISALFYSIGKLIREQELSPFKDFFHGYKINFKDTLKFWVPLLLVLFILSVDLQYYKAAASLGHSILFVLILIGIVFLLVLMLNAFLINAGFVFRTKDVWKLSVYYSFKKLKTTFGNIGIVIITLFITAITSNFLIIFIASLVCYAFMLNSKSVVEDIKLKFCEVQN